MHASYLVCETCRKGCPDGQTAGAFSVQHRKQSCVLELVPGMIFLSDYLRRGYVDTTDPTREPLALVQTSTRPSAQGLFGRPKSAQESFKETKAASRGQALFSKDPEPERVSHETHRSLINEEPQASSGILSEAIVWLNALQEIKEIVLRDGETLPAGLQGLCDRAGITIVFPASSAAKSTETDPLD